MISFLNWYILLEICCDICFILCFIFLVAEAKNDLGKTAIDKEVVEKVRYIYIYVPLCCEVGYHPHVYKPAQVWDRIAPGLASKFDSPHTIPAIAPRPLLILNGK